MGNRFVAVNYPPSSEGGPVEASEWVVWMSPWASTYPPSSEGGPVEASCAASPSAGAGHAIRPPRRAAPLKQHIPRAGDEGALAYPPSSEGGPVEAPLPHRLVSFREKLSALLGGRPR